MATYITSSAFLIGSRGGGGYRTLVGSGVKCSWEVNQAGTFSAFATVANVRKVSGGNMELRGQWLYYDHPTAGRWSGVITATSIVDGIMEIVAQTWEILLRKRLASVGSADALATAPPGTLFYMALNSVLNAAWTGLYHGSFDQSGPPVSAAFDHEDFYDSVAPALTTGAGYEWTIDHAQRVYFQKKIGADRVASVGFYEGKEILTSRWTDDLYPITNRLTAIGVGRTSVQEPDTVTVIKKKKKKKRVTTPGAWVDADFIAGPITVYDQASINKYGPLEELRDLGFVGDETVLANRANEELTELSAGASSSLEIDIADIGNAFAKCYAGDDIGVFLGLAGVAARFRIMVRALDVDAGTMTLSGNASAWYR